MATNINCKKKWHPSRYETQKKVKEAEANLQSEKQQQSIKKEAERRYCLESEVGGQTINRMSWML
ncbi:hypothetical protein HK407_04g06340 [Ordospora pajunii]|jgi:hypothetical protein|uniref:uncharacterized protein n=1 Tax=Ordospora pajunii TaxID=3039483 RepID=UPI0029526EE6|nr:uncharacterized protein HK407_04g06340 [Ordospora pajunii]KAH9411532.1 hypothetical protein HK407_04g06340 [Ordospora pajunii]